jgi:hypothetical protein
LVLLKRDSFSGYCDDVSGHLTETLPVRLLTARFLCPLLRGGTSGQLMSSNHATYKGNRLGRNLLVVGYSLARDLAGSHAHSRILIRHHNISRSAQNLAEAKGKLCGPLARRLCRILQTNYRESPFPRTTVHKGMKVPLQKHRDR